MGTNVPFDRFAKKHRVLVAVKELRAKHAPTQILSTYQGWLWGLQNRDSYGLYGVQKGIRAHQTLKPAPAGFR